MSELGLVLRPGLAEGRLRLVGVAAVGVHVDDFFGIEGVEDALASAASLAAGAAADAVLAAKEAWSGLPPTDDLTLVVIDRSHPAHPDASHDR